MAITRLNSLAIPAGTVEPADISYPLTNFSSTGIDDNAISTALTIDTNGKVFMGPTSAAPDSGAALHVHKSHAGAPVTFGNESMVVVSTNDSAAGVQGYIGSLFFGSQDVSSTDQYVWRAAGIAGYMAGDVGTGGGSADLLFYSTNASQTPTERMRIDSDGNVGIGTSDPARLLTVSGPGGTLLSLVSTNDDNCQVLFGDSASDTVGKVVYAHDTNHMRFETNSAERMRIDSSGDISIGSVSNHSGARIVINDTPPTAFGSPMLQVGQETFTASGYYSIGLGYTAGSYTEPPAEIAAVATSSSGGTTADIVFGTRNVTTNTAVTERMRIKSTGQIGIGTNSISTYNDLEVNGNIYGTMLATNIYGVIGHNLLYAASSWRHVGNGYGYGWAQTGTNGSDLVLYSGTQNTSGHGAAASITARLTVKDGKVGIGQTSPSGKLSVRTVGSAANNAWAGGLDTLYLENSGNWSAPAIKFKEDNSNVGASITGQNMASGAMDLVFATRATSSTTSTMYERMRIDTDGYVGIGITNPSEYLELARTAGKIGWGVNGDYGAQIGYFDDGGGVHGFHVDTKHVGTVTSESRFVVRSNSGYVGIGTKNPNSLLHIGNNGGDTRDSINIGTNYPSNNTKTGKITWRDGSNITGQIDTSYDGTAVRMNIGSLYSSGYNTDDVMRIDPRGVTKPKNPAFYARHSNSSQGVGVIPYNNQAYDIGSNYNTSNYRFTAPVAGYYFFQAHTLVSNGVGGDYRMNIRKNGSRVFGSERIIHKPGSTWWTLDCNALVYLAVNDYVDAYFSNAPSGGSIYGDANYNGFFGYLVS